MMFTSRRIPMVWWIAGVAFLVVGLALLFGYTNNFGAPQKNAGVEQFSIPMSSTTDEIRAKLKADGFIRSTWAFDYALNRNGGEIRPGGYILSKSMNVWRIAVIFSQEPSLKWVTIPEGLRKEEIADILAPTLGWSDEEQEKWITTYTAMKYDYVEGVYFPDTYLIPASEKPFDTAERLRKNFEAKFAPFAEEALKQNIKWDTVVKIASLLEREAAGAHDMPLIAGIIWNRLLQDMRLEIDATLQYARGNTGNGWWAPITPAEKQLDSPYNTYRNKGLPPHPIANPGIDAINAVLYPEETECLFYLHDRLRMIHCAKTYEEHKENIEKYLR